MSLALVPDLDWRADAACLHHNPDLWFPQYGNPGNEARRICATCPVRTDCLDYALTNNEDHGIWGGCSERERRRIRRSRRHQRPGEPQPGTTDRALAYLQANGPATSKAIEKAINYQGPKFSGVLGYLINRGLITSSKTPGQLTRYSLTDGAKNPELSPVASQQSCDGIDRTPVPHPQEHTR